MAEKTGREPSPGMTAFVCGLVLLLFLVLSVTSGLSKSPVADENRYAGFGKYLLNTGDYDNFLLLDQPPLPYLLVSVPFFFFDTPPASGAVRDERYHSVLGRAFLFENSVGKETVLLLGRCMTGLIAVALGALLGFVAYRRYGGRGAILTVGLFAFSPNFIAHSRLMTSDITATLFFLGAAVVWAGILTRPGVRKALKGGLVIALVLLSKVTGVLFLPGLAVAGIVRLITVGRGNRWRWLVRAKLTGLLSVPVAFLVMWAAYGFTTGPVIPTESKMLSEKLWLDHWEGGTRDLLTKPDVPAPAYARLLMHVTRHSKREKPGYMNGRTYRNGDPFFYPFCMLVKLPLGTLLLLAALLLSFLIRRPDPWELSLLVFAAVFFLFGVQARVNIGIRHMLPCLGILFLLVGRLPLIFRRVWLAPLVFLALVPNSLAVVDAHPHYLAFFNRAAGGPQRGHERLVDSNLDWGQDLVGLKEFMDERGIERIRLSYFGAAGMPEAYGIAWDPVVTDGEMGNRSLGELMRLNPGWVAVSATNLRNLYRGTYGDQSWALRFTPRAVIGHSIFVYYLGAEAGNGR